MRLIPLSSITVLGLLKFSESQLAKLRAVSPRLEVVQLTEATFAEIPPDLRDRVEVLYGISGPVLEAHRFPRLKWLQTHSAGVDYLLDTPVWESDIILTSLNGVHTVSMSEYVLAMMLAFRWKIPKMLQFQAKSKWPIDRWGDFIMPELRGSTLGIVGYGAIGRELARQAQALGMRILAANRSGQRSAQRGFNLPGTGDPQADLPEKIYPTAALLEMLPACDYVAVLAPLTPDTHHLFDANAFAAMKESAFFVNLARGGLVDEAALVAALQNRHIAGAALDVFATEPLPADNPLWHLDNLIISPHISGFTPNYDDRATDLFAENLRRYLNNEPLLNLVERGRGY